MKKIICLCLVLLCLLMAACNKTPTETQPATAPRQDPTLTISTSDMYTYTELHEAVWSTSFYLSSTYPDCVVTEVEYDEEYSTTRRGELTKKYENPNMIVVLATFTSGTQVGAELQPNTTYTEAKVILSLAEDGRTWMVEELELP